MKEDKNKKTISSNDKKKKLSKTKKVEKKERISKTISKNNITVKKDENKNSNNKNTVIKNQKNREIVNVDNGTKNKKSLSSLILGIVLLIVLVTVFILSRIFTITNFKEISYEKYINKVKETSESVVYIGNNAEEEDVLKSIASNKKIDIYYINSEKLNDDQKNSIFGTSTSKSMLFITYDGVTNIYFGDYDTDKIVNALVEKKVLSKGLQRITVSEYLNVINSSGYHFMFIGSDSCSWCSKFKPVVEKIAEEYNVDAYYVDLSSVSEEDYYKLVASNSYFSENNWGTPTSFIYKDGESLTAISGYKDESNLLDLFKQYNVVK